MVVEWPMAPNPNEADSAKKMHRIFMLWQQRQKRTYTQYPAVVLVEFISEFALFLACLAHRAERNPLTSPAAARPLTVRSWHLKGTKRRGGFGGFGTQIGQNHPMENACFFGFRVLERFIHIHIFIYVCAFV